MHVDHVGPAVTVITIDEPITSDAVMMPMVMRSIVCRGVAERVESLQVEIDPQPAATCVLQQPRQIARHRGDEADDVAELAWPRWSATVGW